MNRSLLVAPVAICCTWVIGSTLSWASVSQSSVSKASATVTTVARQPIAVVHITNDSDVALEAWGYVLSYEVLPGSSTEVTLMTDALLDEAPLGTPGRGPIQPGESREERVHLGHVPLSATVELQTVVFSNSSSEGDAKSILAQRERYANTLATWIKALNSVSKYAAPQAKAALANLLATERAREPNADSLAVAAQMTLAELLQLDDSAEFADRMRVVKDRFNAQHEKALRHQVR